MKRRMIISAFSILVGWTLSTSVATAAYFSCRMAGRGLFEIWSDPNPGDERVPAADAAPVLTAQHYRSDVLGEDSTLTQEGSESRQSLQGLISSSCNGTQPGVVSLTANASYSVSSTVTIPSNCTLRGNGAKITGTSSLTGDLISVTSAANIHINGPLTLNSANAHPSGRLSHTIIFYNVKHSSVNDVSFTGSTQGELSLFGVSDLAARNLTFANASLAHGASSPAMVIFNWVGGDPTQASTDVNIDGVKCVGSPTTTPGCIYADGNYNRTGRPGQSNERINVSNVSIESTTDDGVEYDHTSGTISGIQCGPGTITNQCVFLRQTSRVKVDNVSCLAGESFCVEVGRFGDDDAVDNISVSHVTGTGMFGTRDSAAVEVRNSTPTAAVTNVTVDGVVADRSSDSGVICYGPGSTGSFLQHIAIRNVTSHHNKHDGIAVAFCQDVTINNVQAFNNNQAGTSCSSPAPNAALRIAYSNTVVVQGIRAYDDQAKKTQCYGLAVDRGSKGVTVSDAEFRDDLHASAGVRNESADAYIVYRKTATATVTIGSRR